MASAAFERFRFSFFEDPDSPRNGLDIKALAALEGEERSRAEDMLLQYLPDTRAVIGLGALGSRQADLRAMTADVVAGESRFSGMPAKLSTSRLKSDSQTSSGAPDDPATLLGTTEYHLKSIRQPGLPKDFEAGATGGIVDNVAVNKGVFRPNDQFGRIGTLACRSNASKPSRIHTPPLAVTQKI